MAMRLYRVTVEVTYEAYVACEGPDEVDDLVGDIINEVNQSGLDVTAKEIECTDDIPSREAWQIPYGENPGQLSVVSMAQKLFAPVTLTCSVPKGREDEIRKLLKDAGVKVE